MQKSEHLALYHCVNEHAEQCLPIMMAHGAVPNKDIWSLVLRLDRCEWAREFVKYGFWPPRRGVAEYCEARYSIREVRFALCQKAVLQVLLIAKRANQPMCHMWLIIAKALFECKYDVEWLKCLK